jgi:sulfane dehydrogenase subunit SoxC
MQPKITDRRRFLTKGAALVGLAALAPSRAVLGSPSAAGASPLEQGGVGDGSADDLNSTEAVLYGRRSRFANVLRKLEGSSNPEGSPARPSPFRQASKTPLGELTGIITPSSLHYTTQHNYGIPDIDPAQHKLMIHGMVDRPLVFSVDELKRLPFVSRIYFIECVANRPNPQGRTVADTHGRAGCSEWTGVPLSVLLNEVGIKNGAKWIVGEGSEGGKHSKSVPIAKALDDVLVAYGQNGEAVRPDHGFPLRLVVPGMEGIYQVKWLRRIKVVDQPYLTFQESSRFLSSDPKTQPNSYEYGPKSVITYPSGTHRLAARGSYVITGLAWSGGGAIRKVEVSTDGGKTYKDARIAGDALPRAFTRFYFPWKWDGEEAVLQSRCLDDKDQLQPSEEEFAKYWGYTRQELYRSSNTRVGDNNWIQAWRVNRDGNVTNGLPPVAFVRDDHMDSPSGGAGGGRAVDEHAPGQ